MEARKTIILLRHGERADLVTRRKAPYYPIRFDPCLTEKGHTQAEISAQFIQSQLPRGSIHIVSSPFLRCLQTASYLSQKLDLPVHIEEGFSEWLHPGDFEEDPNDGLTYLSMPLQAFREQYVNDIDLIINQHVLRPQYPEHSEQCLDRCKRAFDEYVRQREEDVIVIVTHLGVLEFLTEYFSGRSCSLSMGAYCCVTIADLVDGQFNVRVNGSTGHIPKKQNKQLILVEWQLCCCLE